MKKLVLFAAVLAAMMTVRADVLYWMVSDDYAKDAGSSGDSTFATLYATDDNGATKHELATATGSAVADAYAYSDYFTANISSYSGSSYSYFIELVNGVKTTPESYNNLLNNGYISVGGISTPTSLAGGGFGQATGSATYNVPEPTSGLLFLVGGMLLGLKRRRQQV